jgi:hypothetical protein
VEGDADAAGEVVAPAVDGIRLADPRTRLAATFEAASAVVFSNSSANSSPPRRATVSPRRTARAGAWRRRAAPCRPAGVPHGVVHHLEVVEVHEHHRDARVRAVGARARLGHALAQGLAVGQRREDVVLGAETKRVLDAAQSAVAAARARRGARRAGGLGDDEHGSRRWQCPGAGDSRVTRK